MTIPISIGSGAASIAAEAVAGVQYQQIEVLGAGGSSVLSIDATGAAKVNIGGGSVSGTLGSSIIGQLPAGTAMIGSIAAYQGPAAWITSDVKAEDSPSNSGDAGSFSLNVRNDTLSSVSSADGDYTQLTVGPAGEGITANSPFTKWVQGTADLRVVLGASVTAIAAQGASVFTYITGVQVANFGPSSVLVTLGGGLGSILGYTIAPAGGGSNIIYTNALKTGANSAFTASINGTASVLVSAQGFIAKI